MGVLDVGVHLRHRRRHEENPADDPGWEDELLNGPPPPPLQQNETPINRNRPHSRPVKYCHSHGHRNKKGRKPKRRYENTCFLMSLVDHEELEVQEISDFVNTTVSMFAELFTNNSSMKVWDDFVNLPEEEQEKLLSGTSSEQQHSSSGCDTGEDRHLTQEELVASAEASFLMIDKKIRSTLSNKQFPLGSLKYFEEELVSCFSEDPDVVLVSLLPSSFDRLLVHGLCQYLKLVSSTGKFGRMRLLEIENDGRFVLPVLLLSQYLEQRR